MMGQAINKTQISKASSYGAEAGKAKASTK